MTYRHAYDIAVFVGRFQPFHNGHLAVLRRALQEASLCAVVLGSAHQARTPKNPFTWQERAEMIRQALPEADRDRLQFVPIRDYYNETRWAQAVRGAIADLAVHAQIPTARIAMLGHVKDASSSYLRSFPGWHLIALDRLHTADATPLREALFAHTGQSLEPALVALADQVPPSTLTFLRSWSCTPFLHDLAEEWQQLRTEKALWAHAPYPPVFVTVDAVVQCQGHVLLIQRGHAPGKGLYALPGGFIEQRETLFQAALRELSEETHLALSPQLMQAALRRVTVFDHPDRSQRGRIITHAHYFDLGVQDLPEVKADDDAQAVWWVPIHRLASMEDRFQDDHFHLLNDVMG